MSSPTWTADALRSEVRRFRKSVWRAVEAQHIVSTRKLVDSLAEQELLEDIIEASKPALPQECRHLHYLLATPFRYGRKARPSRFRASGESGVFYASERVETAVAEMAFYRLLFFAESPGTPWPDRALEYTAFQVRIATDRALDLTRPPFSRDAALWTRPADHSACQALGRSAREAGVQVIRYASVRDRPSGRNVAVLSCLAFAGPQPVAVESWRLLFLGDRVQAVRDHPRLNREWPVSDFGRDPRLAPLLTGPG